MKITEINLSKSMTVQVQNFEPVTSYYAIKATIEKNDDVEKCKEEVNEKLQKWIEFEILKWKSPNRAITAGRKLGIYNPLPKKEDTKPPF
jgi:hypothetical protein